MLIATIIMFTSASTHLALDIFDTMVTIRGLLIDHSIPDLDSRLVAVTEITSSFGLMFLAVINAALNVRSPFVYKIERHSKITFLSSWLVI